VDFSGAFAPHRRCAGILPGWRDLFQYYHRKRTSLAACTKTLRPLRGPSARRYVIDKPSSRASRRNEYTFTSSNARITGGHCGYNAVRMLGTAMLPIPLCVTAICKITMHFKGRKKQRQRLLMLRNKRAARRASHLPFLETART
jgi:hypothetical protein